MEEKARICVFDYESTPDEAVPGAGTIRRMITKENSGMNLTLSKGILKPGAGHGWHAHETHSCWKAKAPCTLRDTATLSTSPA